MADRASLGQGAVPWSGGSTVATPKGMIPPPPAFGTVAYAEWLYHYQGIIPSWAKRDGKTGKFTVSNPPKGGIQDGGHGMPDAAYDAWYDLYHGIGNANDQAILNAWNSGTGWDSFVQQHQGDYFNATVFDGRGNRVANNTKYGDGWVDPRVGNSGTGTGTGTGTGGSTGTAPKTPEQIAAERDATTILSDLFTSYGLASLVPRITQFIQQGISADAVSILLADTPEYKQRFAANDARLKAGLPVLSPAEYIATERAYRQTMAAAGLPTGFYDTTSDFTNLLSADVSPTELQERVTAATDAIDKAPASTLDYFKNWYSTGDLIAYALDPTKAAPVIEKNLRAAESAGLAQAQGFNLGQSDAEHIAGKNMTLDQVQQGMSFIGGELPTTTKLDQIYGGNVTQQDLLGEVFDSNAADAKKRQALASQERAAFSGQVGGANSASLAREIDL